MIDGVSQWILSLLIIFPILVALIILLIPVTRDCRVHKNIALIGTIVELVFSLHLVKYFVPHSSNFQFAQFLGWLPKSTGINYIVGVDGLSLILVLLTTIFSVIVVMTAYSTVNTGIKGFFALFLLLQ
jgi:NADH-quinone oxidoreductase subunit M